MAIDGISSSSRMRYFGLASGLDVDEIVRGLMLVERAPLDRLVQKKQLLQWQQEELRTINRMLRELDELAFNLRLESAYLARSVSVSDANAVSATVTGNASIGSHTIKVHQLADGLRLYTDKPIADGTTIGNLLEDARLVQRGEGAGAQFSFTITKVVNGQETTSDEITVRGNYTLRELADIINAHASNLGIKAVYEPDLGRFFITSTETGDAVKFRFNDLSAGTEGALSLDDLFAVIELANAHAAEGDPARLVRASTPGNAYEYTGVNAKFEYDGISIERSSNVFTAGGVTYTLRQADPTKEILVSVSQNVDATVEKIKAFVTKYNEVITHINAKLTERRYYDYPPLTEAQRKELKEDEIKLWEERAKSGLLRGDVMLSSILAALREALSSVVSGTGSNYNTLVSIGITTGGWDERGLLHLDEGKLRQALETDPQGVAALFRQDGSDVSSKGIILRVREVLASGIERLTNRVGRTGAAVDSSTIGRQIGWIDEAIERAEARLAQREAYYYRQFSVLESFMNQANAQSLWLTQVFLSWAG